MGGGYSVLKATLIYIKDFVFVGQHYNSWMLWYLLSTVYSVISIFLLRKANVKWIMILVISGVIFGSSIAIDIFHATSHTTLFMITLDFLLKNTLGNGRLLRGFFYITLGMFMCSKRLFFKNSLLVTVFLISFIASVIMGDEISGTILLIPCVWGLFGIVVKLQGSVNSHCAVLRKMSTEMYFIHLWVWTIYYTLVYGNKTYGFDSFLATTAVSILVSAFVVVVWPQLYKSTKARKN